MFLALTSVGDTGLLLIGEALGGFLHPAGPRVSTSTSEPCCISAACWARLCCSSCSANRTIMSQRHQRREETAAVSNRHLDGSESGQTSLLFSNVFPVLILPLLLLQATVLFGFLLPLLQSKRVKARYDGYGGQSSWRHVQTFRLLARMRLRAAWPACCLAAWRRYQRWMVTAAWFTC